MLRLERQIKAVEKWIKSKGKSTIEAATGFGKTRCGVFAIKAVRKKNPDAEIIVVVPNNYLKTQWDKLLEENAVKNNVSVMTIQRIVRKKNKLSCSLLICDEIHRYASTQFANLFVLVDYKYILGLTARIKRNDRKHIYITRFCPIVEKISIEECIANGWIADLIEINVPVDEDPDVMQTYFEKEKLYDESVMKFYNNYSDMRRAVTEGLKPIVKPDGSITDPLIVKIAKERGWKGYTASEAYKRLENGIKVNEIWGGTSHANPTALYIIAVNGVRAMNHIKKVIQDSDVKIKAAAKIAAMFPERKKIVFTMTIQAAEKLSNIIPDSFTYHSKSKMKTEDVKNILQTKNTICVAKALDEGADFPEISMGIRVSGTSSPINHIQRRGRIMRKTDDRKSIMINLYVRNTKEEKWLAKSQDFSSNVVWLESIDELKNYIDNIEKTRTVWN